MSSQFDATASMLGYLYQVRLALLDSLRRLRRLGTFSVSIETLDDVAFEKQGSPTELLQTKHHIDRQANLSDASPDLWKSLRVWVDALEHGRIGTDSVLYLVTTGEAPAGSAASYPLNATETCPLGRVVSELGAMFCRKQRTPDHAVFAGTDCQVSLLAMRVQHLRSNRLKRTRSPQTPGRALARVSVDERINRTITKWNTMRHAERKRTETDQSGVTQVR